MEQAGTSCKWEVDLVAVDNPNIENAWRLSLPYLRRAMAYSGDSLTEEFVWQELQLCNYQLWVVRNGRKVHGALVTTTKIFPASGQKQVEIVLLAGDSAEAWEDTLWDRLVQFTKAASASSLIVRGRRGFIKRLKKFGFVPSYSVFVREV